MNRVFFFFQYHHRKWKFSQLNKKIQVGAISSPPFKRTWPLITKSKTFASTHSFGDRCHGNPSGASGKKDDWEQRSERESLELDRNGSGSRQAHVLGRHPTGGRDLAGHRTGRGNPFRAQLVQVRPGRIPCGRIGSRWVLFLVNFEIC